MKRIFHDKTWNQNAVQVHVEPPPIPLNKIKNDDIKDKYCVKIELRRDPTSQKLDLYELRMALFDNSESEEFCCF